MFILYNNQIKVLWKITRNFYRSFQNILKYLIISHSIFFTCSNFCHLKQKCKLKKIITQNFVVNLKVEKVFLQIYMFSRLFLIYFPVCPPLPHNEVAVAYFQRSFLCQLEYNVYNIYITGWSQHNTRICMPMLEVCGIFVICCVITAFTCFRSGSHCTRLWVLGNKRRWHINVSDIVTNGFADSLLAYKIPKLLQNFTELDETQLLYF